MSEPVLYRHFPSKRDVYFACLDEAWARLRAALEAKIAEFGVERAPLAIAKTSLGLRSVRVLPPNLWMQAITEAGCDPEIRRPVRRHMREVHDFIADILRRAQAAGAIPADRDPDAEAWIFIAGGLLITVGDRLGGLLGHEDFTRISTQHYRWLFGRDPEVSPTSNSFLNRPTPRGSAAFPGGVADGAGPEGTVSTHGPGRHRAVSGARRRTEAGSAGRSRRRPRKAAGPPAAAPGAPMR